MDQIKQYRRVAHAASRNIVRRMGTEVIKSKKDKKQRIKLHREIASGIRRYFDKE